MCVLPCTHDADERKGRRARETSGVHSRDHNRYVCLCGGSGDTAGPLGMADIFTAFYFHILAHDPKKPDWEERDRLILSNGHICPVQYAAMAHAVISPFRVSHTSEVWQSASGIQSALRLPGLETTSGPLGEGLSQAAGIAYAFRMDGGERCRTYHVLQYM